MSAPRNAVRPGVAEARSGIHAVDLADVAIGVVLQEGAQGFRDRHTLIQQRDAVSADLGVHARLRRDATREGDEGTNAPTAGRAVATATPNPPTAASWATMENVQRSSMATTQAVADGAARRHAPGDDAARLVEANPMTFPLAHRRSPSPRAPSAPTP